MRVSGRERVRVSGDHCDGPLQDLVLKRRNADGSHLLSVRLRNLDSPHRWCSVRPGLRSVEQRLEVLSVRVLLRHLRSLVSPTSFSPNGPVVRHSLPSTGSLGHFPCFNGYYEGLGLLAARPASLRIPSNGSTFLAKGDDGISQVPGGPWRACLAHRPRWVRCIQSDHSGWPSYPLLQRCCLPLWVDGVGTHRHFLSGLNHTAPTLAVYASQLSFPLSQSYGHARLASGWWSTLAGRDLSPATSQHEVSFTFPLVDLLLIQALPGAPTPKNPNSKKRS